MAERVATEELAPPSLDLRVWRQAVLPPDADDLRDCVPGRERLQHFEGLVVPEEPRVHDAEVDRGSRREAQGDLPHG